MPIPSEQARTLTVFCSSGLSNRLKVLLSGLALAEASGRRFRMFWPLTPACSAPFQRLFANSWNVELDVNDEHLSLPTIDRLRQPHDPDLLASELPNLTVGHVSWLLFPARYPNHAALMQRCQDLIQRLQPLSEIQHRVNEFHGHYFRSFMIGVHVRRGDFLRRRPDVVANTSEVLICVDGMLQKSPEAGILLCTDDGAVDQVTGVAYREGVHRLFLQRYGDRVVFTAPRSLDRRNPEAIADALVDLLLLRRTQGFVGTQASSFTELAVFGRPVESVRCGAPTPRYRRLERWGRLTGLTGLLRRAPLSRRLGPNPSFRGLWEYYTGLPTRLGNRLIRLLRKCQGDQ